MKKTILTLVLAAALLPAFAQRFAARSARVSFFSSTPVENIEAVNDETACELNAQTSELHFVVPITSFKMENETMRVHFNENYMESSKYPKAEFKGNVSGAGLNLTKDGTYPVQAAGKLTIHGVTRDVTIPGTLTVKNGTVSADSKFTVRCADYGVKIPSVVASKVAEEIKVTVAANMIAGR